jgi:uncharacterized membrane protein
MGGGSPVRPAIGPATTRLAWTAFAALALVGIVAAAGRAVFAADAGVRLEPVRDALLGALGRPDPLAVRRAADVAAFDAPFAAHPVLARIHVVAGGLFFLLAPLQLIGSLRARRPAVHRWNGRLLIVASLAMTGTAFYFGLRLPFAGAGEAVLIALIGSWFLVAGWRGVAAIKRGEVALHREWMLRAAAVPVGVSVIRVIGAVLDVALVRVGPDPRVLFQAALWSGWAISLAAAEWWVRGTRAPVAGQGASG